MANSISVDIIWRLVYLRLRSIVIDAEEAIVILLLMAWHVKIERRWWRASESMASSLVVTVIYSKESV